MGTFEWSLFAVIRGKVLDSLVSGDETFISQSMNTDWRIRDQQSHRALTCRRLSDSPRY